MAGIINPFEVVNSHLKIFRLVNINIYYYISTAVLTKDIKPIVVDVIETTGEAMEM